MSARERLQETNATISLCATMLRGQIETIERFLKETSDMDSFGPIVDPTLFMNKERQVVSAALKPIYEAARNFSVAYETHTAKLKAAAEKVGVKLGARA